MTCGVYGFSSQKLWRDAVVGWSVRDNSTISTQAGGFQAYVRKLIRRLVMPPRIVQLQIASQLDKELPRLPTVQALDIA